MPMDWMSDYGPQIFEYIKQNEPTTRKEIIKEFKLITPKTVYLNVAKLIDKQRIFQSDDGMLSTKQFDIPVWRIPVVLRNFTNLSPITNAFARQNKEFLQMCSELSHKYGEQTTVLICDLLTIANTLNEAKEELASQFKYSTKVDVHDLTNNFKLLEELISQYRKAKVIDEKT